MKNERGKEIEYITSIHRQPRQQRQLIQEYRPKNQNSPELLKTTYLISRPLEKRREDVYVHTALLKPRISHYRRLTSIYYHL